MRDDGASAEVELLHEIARGSEEGLSRLYDRYSKLVYSLALAILRDPRDAEEALQEVFLQVWKQARRYDSGKSTVYQWLMRLTRSRAIDRTRARNFSRRRDAETTLAPADGIASREASQLDAYLAMERGETVRRLLTRITPAQQQVMHLAYFLGHTQQEIARQLEIPLGTVKTRMRDALRALHGLLAGELRP